ncbi:hypothetical protein COY07_02795 [Candidatus Peregrinibacteria bacterium CG_4_10_14_0_2_um_filter_43_11]|nr:MAG: hypothetical protein COY07_02795 [Candidatus Peregrinibacteria bacterium CG_4_10_14_0_2_um_filter_43_11]
MTRTIAIKSLQKPLSLSPKWTIDEVIKVTSPSEGEGQLPIDILENEKELLVVTPIAGINVDETEIVVTNDVLTIRGKRDTKIEAFGFKDKHYYARECFWGSFSRSVILPANVEADLIEATQKDHVLYVRIPKRQHVRMRIVKIKS